MMSVSLKKRYGVLAAIAALSACGAMGCEPDVTSHGVECGDAVCTSDQTCVDGKCVPELCGNVVCKEGQECVNDVCVDITVDPCADVTCNDDEKCVDGECKPVGPSDPCAGVTCTDGSVCVNGNCVKSDPCATVNCNDGQRCLEGKCYDNECVENDALISCEAGKICSKGDCVDDGCDKVNCAATETCVEGLCVETDCIGVHCETGNSCKAGRCIENACLSVECPTGEICKNARCIPEACKDVDCPQDKVCQNDGTCAFDSAPELSAKLVGDDNVTDEDGKSAAVELVLNHQPASDVTVSCESSNVKEGTVECNVTFTAENWNVPQQVTVNGVKDSAIDGDKEYSVSFKTASEDAEFNELTAQLNFINKDTSSNGVVVTLPDELVTSEDGGTIEFEVSLSAAPESNVTFTISSSLETEGKVSVDSVTFTPENWNVPQKVTVTGQDDSDADGSKEYQILFGKTVSDDANWNDLETAPIDLVNQDNDSAGITIPSGRVNVNELDLVGQKTIVLNTKPEADVTLTFTVSNPNEIAVDAETMTFTTENWNVPQTLTISGVPDHVVDADAKETITVAVTSDDKHYDGLKDKDKDITIYVTNKNTDTANLTLLALGADYVTEAGSTADYNISLTSKPSADVTVNALVMDATELAIVTGEHLTFTPDNWDVPQLLTVKGVDDDIVDGNQKTVITFNADSADQNFKKLSTNLSFITIDDDQAVIVVTGNDASLKEDKAETATFTVALASKPSSNVTVDLTGYDTTEIALSTTKLTFTTSNWKTPQTVTVTSVDDKEADGPQTTSVILTASSSDKNYNGVKANSPSYTIIDNEGASIAAAPASLTIRPTTTATFTISLSSQPSENVTIAMTPSNTNNAINLSSNSVTFTKNDWASKTITVSSAGTFKKAVATETISFKVTSAGAYGSAKVANISVKVYGMTANTVEEAPVFVSSGSNYTNCDATVKRVTLYPGKYKLQVWGASGGDGVGRVQNVSSHCGLGGYSEGILELTETTTAYIHQGATGLDGLYNQLTGAGCNGGGMASKHSNGSTSYGGGGGTDIRLVEDTLYHRVIVAGGGGGADNSGGTIYGSDDGSGGVGGGESGGYGLRDGAEGYAVVAPGTQTSGFKFGEGDRSYVGYDIGGGGGGWWGGKAASGTTGNYGGGGGSGFVYTSATAKNVPAEYKLTSKYYLKDAKTVGTENLYKNRSTSFPAVNGGTEMGHSGHGYARITLIE